MYIYVHSLPTNPKSVSRDGITHKELEGNRVLGSINPNSRYLSLYFLVLFNLLGVCAKSLKVQIHLSQQMELYLHLNLLFYLYLQHHCVWYCIVKLFKLLFEIFLIYNGLHIYKVYNLVSYIQVHTHEIIKKSLNDKDMNISIKPKGYFVLVITLAP
jgi:hypothetical protein